jgi:hypothetical protein
MMKDPTFRGKDMFSTIAPMGWEHCVPLQPADLVAYESFKDALRKYNAKASRPSLDYLLQSKQFEGRAKQLVTENLDEWKQILDSSAKSAT